MEELYLFSLFAVSLVSIVFTAGVVWRVEQKLDVSFKLLLAASVVFALGAGVELLAWYRLLPPWDYDKITRPLFLVLFTAGIFEMRSLVIDLERREQVRQSKSGTR